MLPLKGTDSLYHKLLCVLVLAAGAASCSSDEPTPSPADDGIEIGYKIDVVGSKDESRCIHFNTAGNSYEFTTANFRANNPIIQMRMERNEGDSYVSFPSEWCVNMASTGDYRTAQVNAEANGNPYNKDTDFVHHPNYWKAGQWVYVYAMTGHTNCDWGIKSTPHFTEIGSAASLGDRLVFDGFSQSLYHPQDLLFGYGKAIKSFEEYTADPTIHVKFNHAMAKITFEVKNANPNISIHVDNIRIGNLYNQGRFNYNKAMSIMGWDADKITNINDANVASVWSDLKNKITFHVEEPRTVIVPFDLAYDECKVAQNAGFSTPFFYTMVPQKIGKWRLGAPDNACILLTCTITDTANGKIIWQSNDSNGIILPMTSGRDETERTFLPGRHYHYHIEFPNNTTPDGGWDNNGNPVLVPVAITADVTNWIEESWTHWYPQWWN